jgi:hypothetical protein
MPERISMRTRSLVLLCSLLYPAIIPLRGEPPSGVIANSPNPEPEEKTFQWGPAITQSFTFLAVEHSIRLTQGKTRRELSGKVFKDYFASVDNVAGWGDGDGVFTNYIGHPMQGAVASFIQIQNDPKGKHLDFGNNSEYWHSRLKAFAWSAAYSTQFEVGPLSEASIGHVGKTPGTAGAVDLVITPTAGVGLSVLEDIVDRYIIRKMEGNTNNRVRKVLLRATLNPNRAFANVLRGKVPWHRDTRPGVWRPQ